MRTHSRLGIVDIDQTAHLDRAEIVSDGAKISALFY